MKQLILLLTALLSLIVAQARPQGAAIYGNTKGLDGKVIEAATITLLQLPDKKTIKLNITDKKGDFSFENLKEGSYQLLISAVGYQSVETDAIQIASGKDSVFIDTKPLVALEKNLGEVVVQGKQRVVENKIDKTVVNVDAMISNAGGTALEVLEKSPGVSVDRDGNISLKGKQGVVILIDGKPSYLGGQDLANYLRNMPSNQLDQLEIMTQPPAKYDASGNSGVINIKTKKNKQNGFNGNINLSYIQAVYPKSPNSISFNWRKNKVNLFASYGFAYWQGFNDVTIYRKFHGNSGGITSAFDQSAAFSFISRNHNAKVGLDFYASKNTTIGVSLSGNYNPRDNYSKSRANILNGNYQLDSINTASNSDHTLWKNVGANVNLRRILDSKGKEITADADYVWYNSAASQNSSNNTYLPDGSMTQYPGISNPYLLHGNLPSDIKIYSIKADYTHPIRDGERFEAGFKSSMVKTDNNAIYTFYDKATGVWKNDLGKSNHFLYDENINAVYVNYNKQFKKWGLQAGLRLENTNGKGIQLTDKKEFTRNYTQLFPTLYITHNLNDKNILSLNYGRRINRPNYQDMNPFIYFLDQYTYRQGNPYLLPQFSHNIELSHSYDGKLITTLNYTVTTDIINDILTQNNDTKTTIQTRSNIAKNTNIGLSVSYNNNITKWYMISFYGNAFNNHFKGIVNAKPLDVSIASYMFNINNQFRFNKGWGAEVSGFYRSKTQDAGIIVANPMGVVHFAVSKQILKNKATLKLNFSDPFYIQRFSGFTKFDNIDAIIKSKWDNRRIGLSLTYRFGKAQQQQASRRRNGSAQEEQNRVGATQQNQ